MAWPVARLVGTRWRDRVTNPDELATCVCGHAEQLHAVLHGACTAGPTGFGCLCDGFVEKRRERVA